LPGRIATYGLRPDFFRSAGSTFASFDASGTGAGSGKGTQPIGNHPAGAFKGFYIDDSGL
jgi:hypothetical protein